MNESSCDSGFFNTNESSFDSEEYSAELDRLLEQYEQAAKNEQYHLLQFSFHLVNSDYVIECGLSPARSFSPVVKLQMQTNKIIFIATEWYEFINILMKLQNEFFKNNCDKHDCIPIACGDFPNITISKLIYDGNVKQVMVMKQLSWLYLSEEDVEQIVKINQPLISFRLTLLEKLNFCLYYYNILSNIRKIDLKNFKDVSVIDLLHSFCNSESNILLANALKDYIFYYKDTILADFNIAP